VAKPIERPTAITLPPVEREQPAVAPPGLWKAKKTDTQSKHPPPDQTELPTTFSSTTPGAATPAADELSLDPQDSVKRELESIRALLSEQNRTLAAQSEKIQFLAAEIDSLKKKLS